MPDIQVPSSGGGNNGPSTALSDDTPEPNGTAAAGTSEEASRSDHVHASTAGVLAAKTYGGKGSNPSTTSSTFADIDATNLAVTFTAPASGSVLIIWSGIVGIDTANSTYAWNVRDASGDVAGTSITVEYGTPVASGVTRMCVKTGLTPGQSYTWKWGHARTFGSGTPKLTLTAADDKASLVILGNP